MDPRKLIVAGWAAAALPAGLARAQPASTQTSAVEPWTAGSSSSTAAVELSSAVARSEEDIARSLQNAHSHYFQGDLARSAEAYRKIRTRDPRTLEAWLNGALVWKELGKNAQAVEWLSQAALLSPRDPKILTALGWAEFHHRDLQASETRFRAALTLNPKELYALLGLGRVELATRRFAQAALQFSEAAESDPRNTLAQFWKGQALDGNSDLAAAIDAYKQAALSDSYFIEGRFALGRAYMRRSWFREAAYQFKKVLDADPENPRLKIIRQKIKGFWSSQAPYEPSGPRIEKEAEPRPPAALGIPPGEIPTLRVGVGTNAMGKPLPRKTAEFKCTTPFDVVDAKSGKRLASGRAGQTWQVRFTFRKKTPRMALVGPDGRHRLAASRALRIRPESEKGGKTTLSEPLTSRNRTLRGEIEIALHPTRRAFEVVNVVDLETYSHGVLSAEMPIDSPLEALKAQAVVARTEALYIKRNLRRHRVGNYDLCDGQHCQVYTGVSAETRRSRQVVDATRGRVVAYQGKAAHVLYSSNCGGHTQSGWEVSGWGDVPYWRGAPDSSPGSPPYPRSPWELWWWLRQTPKAYCMPSRYVYPSHYRWNRIIAAKDLEEKLNRSRKIGRLVGLRTLRRARSGHLNAVLILGSRRNVKVTDEARMRNLLGIGSQRSALFLIETEYDDQGRPETFVFHGAGWGHGVGLCQSGSIGRAEQGQTYDEILKAYFPGSEIGNLRY
ncbi:MAG: SpoIID/LytB domain-containing protein [Elusimicrobia bacterium]|nr:SpoIID/LytB domain-containing protein [Elusimicrobiota bacterium]